MAVGIGQEILERYCTNKSLAQIFKPRGLYALVVMYKQGKIEKPEIDTEQADLCRCCYSKV